MEKLSRINPSAINENSGVSSGEGLTRYDIIASLDDTPAGQLMTYIAQHAQPPMSLKILITDKMANHYDDIKYKKQWSKQSKSIDPQIIKIMGLLIITSLINNKKITQRRLSRMLSIPKTTLQNNYMCVFTEIENYLLSKISKSTGIAHEKLK